jgi:polysaccharide export outer membrane protein
MSFRSRWACRPRSMLAPLAGLLVVCCGCQWMSQSSGKRVESTPKKPATVAGSGWIDASPPVDSGNTASPAGTGWMEPGPKESNAAQEPPQANVAVRSASSAAQPSGDKTVLAAGDAIEVKFYYTPDLDVNQVVRPDGYISMQLLGEVKAAGKTPSDLEGELTAQYGWHLKNPRISVIVRSLINRRVYVSGQVAKPGMVLMPGPMTVMEAIAEVGGVTHGSAKAENVLVIRYEGRQRRVFEVDMKSVFKLDPKKGKKEVAVDLTPFDLQPKDVVYVPETKIVQVDRWVDQHINQILPRFLYIAWYPVK